MVVLGLYDATITEIWGFSVLFGIGPESIAHTLPPHPDEQCEKKLRCAMEEFCHICFAAPCMIEDPHVFQNSDQR